MLPALRKALQGFTKRADIIIRQMSYLASSSHNDMAKVCQQLVAQPRAEQDRLLVLAGDLMAVPRVGLVDPVHLYLHSRRSKRTFQLDVAEDRDEEFDRDAHRELVVQQWLDQAFLINDTQVRRFLARHLLAGEAVKTSDLPVDSAGELLSLAHAIEVGSANSLTDELQFSVEYSGSEPVASAYFHQQDQFEIRIRETLTAPEQGKNHAS